MREIFEQCLYIKNKIEEVRITLDKYKKECKYKEFRDAICRIIYKLDLITLHTYRINAVMSAFTDIQIKDTLDKNNEIIKILKELIEVTNEIENIDKFENISKIIEATEQEYMM